VRTLTVREREKVPIGTSGGLTEDEANALARLECRLPRGSIVWEHHGVRFGAFCGVLLAGSTTIEILPKIDTHADSEATARGVLIAMLRASGRLADSIDRAVLVGLQRFHLLDVFILDFCALVNDRVRQGAIRTYQLFEERLPTVRGRLQLTEHLRRGDADRSRIYCRFDELSVDNPHNRILKDVLRKLLGSALGAEARGAVNGLLRRLEEVRSVPCHASDVASLPFSRLINVWRPVFARAAWFLNGLYPDVQAGNAEGVGLLFDMERLFEAFVGVKLRSAWGGTLGTSGLRIVLQGPPKYLATTPAGPAFGLRPDASLVTDTDTIEGIFDAKWKRLEPNSANLGVSRDDAYQLASYAGRYQCSRVALVYPRREGLSAGLIETFELQLPGSPRVDVYALDLLGLTNGGSLPEGLKPILQK
jgi:5-methylcytosine-specific restriction enzyme subunit McrC